MIKNNLHDGVCAKLTGMADVPSTRLITPQAIPITGGVTNFFAGADDDEGLISRSR